MKILIVGAGIAGSATAVLLSRHGHEVTVIDAATEPYSGGYLLLLNDTALKVMDQLGARDLANELSAPAPTIGVHWSGRKLTEFTPSGYRLARRGDLVGAFSQMASEEVPITFGKKLIGVQHHLSGVTAYFTNTTSEDFDLIIGADGLNSTVRRLVIEDQSSNLYRNGRINLWVNIPGRLARGTRAWILTGGSTMAQVFSYPDVDQTLVITTVDTKGERYEVSGLLPRAAELLRNSGEEFAQLAWDVLRAAPEQARITPFAQVRVPRWHAKNVILVGDAAHCIDPLSGLGAYGALQGSSILAEELRRHPNDISTAAARYARRAKGFIRPAQLLTAAMIEAATASTLRQYSQAASMLLSAAAAACWG